MFKNRVNFDLCVFVFDSDSCGHEQNCCILKQANRLQGKFKAPYDEWANDEWAK